jgi:hypothetical protein
MKMKKIIRLVFIALITLHAQHSAMATTKVQQYYCTAADDRHFPLLLNLIGSIHVTNFDQLGEIAVFDIGFTQEQIQFLNTISKVSVHRIKGYTHPDILTRFTTSQTPQGIRQVPGWYAWKFVILKEALDLFPHILWVDAGTTILKPLDDLFSYIDQTGYFLSNMGNKVNNQLDHDIRWGTTQYVKAAFNLTSSERKYVLDQEPLLSGTIGVSHKAMEYLVMPLYNFTHNLRLFEDDGSTPNGFGTGRHDQTVLSIFAYLHGLTIHHQDHTQQVPMYLTVDSENKEFYITWHGACINEKTCLYNSRWDVRFIQYFLNAIRYKDKNSMVLQ